MEVDKFKTLIYAKQFNNDLTHKLLRIADSGMILEDLLTLIKEDAEAIYLSDSADEIVCCTDCRTDLEEERDELKEENKGLEIFKAEVKEISGRLSNLFPVSPEYNDFLMTVTCGCGKQLSMNGKQPGWVVDFRGPVVFKCPCGEEQKIEIKRPWTDKTPLCSNCEADDPNDPPCDDCAQDRPVR